MAYFWLLFNPVKYSFTPMFPFKCLPFLDKLLQLIIVKCRRRKNLVTTQNGQISSNPNKYWLSTMRKCGHFVVVKSSLLMCFLMQKRVQTKAVW